MRSRKKTIVVTGASSGVGLDICRHFEKIGWNVIGLARRVAALKVGKVKFIQADGRTLDFYNKIRHADIGNVDVLVNNAGVFLKSSMMGDIALASSDVDNVIDTNLKGTIYATMACLKVMKPGARIINIGSVAGTHGIPYQALYCASKYGVNGFFESLQHELLPRGILLTTICPGGINTPLWDKNKYKGDRNKLLRAGDITSIVDYIAVLPPHVVFKNATLYPSNEIH